MVCHKTLYGVLHNIYVNPSPTVLIKQLLLLLVCMTLTYYLMDCIPAVRQKAGDIRALVQDDLALRDERKKAKKNKDKYIGICGGLTGQRYSEWLVVSY